MATLWIMWDPGVGAKLDQVLCIHLTCHLRGIQDLIGGQLGCFFKDRWLYILSYKPPNIVVYKFESTFALLCDVVRKETSNAVILEKYKYDKL